MPDHTDNINWDKVVYDDQNVERRYWSCLGQTCFRSLIVFLSQIFVILLIVCGWCWRISLTETCDESTVWVGIVCKAAGYILPSPKFWTSLFLQKTAFLFLWLDRAILAKRTWYISGWKLEHFHPKLTLFIFSINNLNHSMMSCKKLDNLEFVQGVHFEIIISLKNNVTKYMIIFDNSCAEICNSKEFVNIATAGRHRGFSTIYIKHNLFHQSKLGRDVELQNALIVLFKSLRDEHQVATLGLQLGLGSTLVDWYRDATSVLLVICWLICLREQTIAYATAQIAEIFHQSFMLPTTWSI